MTIAAALEDSYDSMLIDGNVDGAAVRAACDAARTQRFDAVGVTVMGGPQVATAIEVSRALRAAQPDLPIVWGGYFPTLYPSVALNNDYVDFVVRGQGEDTFVDLMEALARPGREKLAAVEGLSWRQRRRCATQPRARLHAQAHRADAALRQAARRQGVPREDVSRAADGRAPGGARLPVPLHILRRRGNVQGRDGVAPGRAPRPGNRLSQAARRRFDSVLRPQLLRPRRGHGAAARSARAPRAAVVVLRACRCARESVSPKRGGSSARAACAWRTLVPRRRTTGC